MQSTAVNTPAISVVYLLLHSLSQVKSIEDSKTCIPVVSDSSYDYGSDALRINQDWPCKLKVYMQFAHVRKRTTILWYAPHLLLVPMTSFRTPVQAAEADMWCIARSLKLCLELMLPELLN